MDIHLYVASPQNLYVASPQNLYVASPQNLKFLFFISLNLETTTNNN